MSLHNTLEYIQNWPLAEVMRSETPGTEWTFSIVETIHVLALAVVFGSIAMLDMRLLGWTARDSKVAALMRETLPWTWCAWVIAALSGSLLFISKATTYASNLDFQLKFVCMALAGINMAVFHFGPYRYVATWDTAPRAPTQVRVAGGLSMLLWIGVIFFGRWVGFTT
jgi:hypothetical protein